MHPAHPNRDKQPGIKALCVLHAFLHRQTTSSSSMRHSSTVQFHNAKGTKLSAKCCLDMRNVRNEPPSSSEGRRDQRERTTLALNALGEVSMLSTQPKVHNALPLSPPNNAFDILSVVKRVVTPNPVGKLSWPIIPLLQSKHRFLHALQPLPTHAEPTWKLPNPF